MKTVLLETMEITAILAAQRIVLITNVIETMDSVTRVV